MRFTITKVKRTFRTVRRCSVKLDRELDLMRVMVLLRECNEVREKGGSQGYKQADDYVKPWDLS